MVHRHARTALAGAVLVFLILMLLGPALLGGRILTTGDAMLFDPPFAAERPASLAKPSNPLDNDELFTFQPQLLKTRHALGQGGLGLWTSDVGAGRPLLASQQQAPLFPMTWLAFLLPFWSSLAWMAAGRVLLAAAGTYAYCRELGHGRGPALLAGVSFAFGTYMITWLTHPHANVWALLPWLFLLVRRLARSPGAGPAIGLATAIGLSVLGGHPESCAIVLAAAAAYAAFELAHARGELRRLAGWFAGALVAGLCVGAVMIVPLAELLGVATTAKRGGPPLARFAIFPFTFPELAGRPDKAFSGGGVVNFQERSAYFGVLPVLLALGGLIVRRRATELFLAGLALVCLLLIFENPVARLARELPGGDVVNLTRLLVVVTFAGAVLAAAGLETALRGDRAVRRRLLRVMGAAGAAIFAGGLAVAVVRDGGGSLAHVWQAVQQLPATHPAEADKGVIALGAVWRWGLLSGVAIAGMWWAWRRGASRAAVTAFAVALVALDLVTMARGYRPMVPRRVALPPDPPALRWARDHAGGGRVVGQDPVLGPDLASRFGLRTPGSYDLPEPARHSALYDALVMQTSDRKRFDVAAPGARLLATLFGVREVMLAPGAAVPSWLHVAHDDRSGRVAEYTGAAPRAWIAYDWRPARTRPAALLMTLSSAPADVTAKPVIEGGATLPGAALQPPGRAAVVGDRDEEVTVRANARAPGYLVLDDSFYPGWQAEVDGREKPILPANENFRAVALPPGAHTVRFRYRPASIGWSAALSGFVALALLLGAAAVRRTRRRASRVSPA